MPLVTRSRAATVAVLAGIALVSGTGGAVAGALVTGAQIKDESVTGVDIRNGSLGRADLAVSARGLSGVKVLNASTAVASGAWATASATCPTGTKVLTADGWLSNARSAVQVEITGSTGIAWSPVVESPDTVRIRVVCAVY